MTGTIPWLTVPVALGLWLIGIAWLAVVDSVTTAVLARQLHWGTLLTPFRAGLRDLYKEFRPTEAPDGLLWLAAPALLIALTLAALTVLPLSPQAIAADLSVGVVFFTAMFALTLVAVYWAGWGPNSKYPLIGGYRFVGLMLAYEMPLAITIIAVALPAESLALNAIVATQQAGLWNAVLQPLGLLIYLLCALAVPFWGPFAVSDGPDLAEGVMLELSGPPRLLWRLGQRGLLLTTAAFSVPLFLGGGAGPWWSAPVWSLIKIALVAALLTIVARWLGRLHLERFMKLAWIGLIPLSLANLFLVGLLILIWPALAGGG